MPRKYTCLRDVGLLIAGKGRQEPSAGSARGPLAHKEPSAGSARAPPRTQRALSREREGPPRTQRALSREREGPPSHTKSPRQGARGAPSHTKSPRQGARGAPRTQRALGRGSGGIAHRKVKFAAARLSRPGLRTEVSGSGGLQPVRQTAVGQEPVVAVGSDPSGEFGWPFPPAAQNGAEVYNRALRPCFPIGKSALPPRCKGEQGESIVRWSMSRLLAKAAAPNRAVAAKRLAVAVDRPKPSRCS